MTKMARIVLAVALLLSLCTCGAPTRPEDYDLINAVFPGAYALIEIGQPEFDAVTGSTPTFTWKATGNDLVYVGVFNQNIQIQSGRIANPQANVWAWHTGLGTGREGNVRFSDGRDVVNGELLADEPPTPLESGHSYSWAVWAWDERGTSVTHASQEMFFTVE